MKITNAQLKQIIKEELNKVLKESYSGEYFRPAEFDPRAKKNYPQHSDKLTDMYKDDPAQAMSLASALEEPLDIEVGENENSMYGGPFLKRLIGQPRHNYEPIYRHFRSWVYDNYRGRTGDESFSNENILNHYEQVHGKQKADIVRTYNTMETFKKYINK